VVTGGLADANAIPMEKVTNQEVVGSSPTASLDSRGLAQQNPPD